MPSLYKIYLVDTGDLMMQDNLDNLRMLHSEKEYITSIDLLDKTITLEPKTYMVMYRVDQMMMTTYHPHKIVTYKHVDGDIFEVIKVKHYHEQMTFLANKMIYRKTCGSPIVYKNGNLGKVTIRRSGMLAYSTAYKQLAIVADMTHFLHSVIPLPSLNDSGCVVLDI